MYFIHILLPFLILISVVIILIAYLVYLVVLNQVISYVNEKIIPEIHRQLWLDFNRGDTTTTTKPEELHIDKHRIRRRR